MMPAHAGRAISAIRASDGLEVMGSSRIRSATLFRHAVISGVVDRTSVIGTIEAGILSCATDLASTDVVLGVVFTRVVGLLLGTINRRLLRYTRRSRARLIVVRTVNRKIGLGLEAALRLAVGRGDNQEQETDEHSDSLIHMSSCRTIGSSGNAVNRDLYWSVRPAAPRPAAAPRAARTWPRRTSPATAARRPAPRRASSCPRRAPSPARRRRGRSPRAASRR